MTDLPVPVEAAPSLRDSTALFKAAADRLGAVPYELRRRTEPGGVRYRLLFVFPDPTGRLLFQLLAESVFDCDTDLVPMMLGGGKPLPDVGFPYCCWLPPAMDHPAWPAFT